MLLKRLTLVIFLFCVAIFCMLYMNLRYDKLARYPYDIDYKQHEVIVNNLTNDQIEYIIEWAIHPSEFMNYIELPGYNIYSNALYKSLDYYCYTEDKGLIVEFANLAVNKGYSEEYMIEILHNYRYDQAIDYLKNDISNNASLISNPHYSAVFFKEDQTIYTFIPNDLVSLEGIPSVKINKEYQKTRSIVYNNLSNLCSAIGEEYTKSCGGIVIEKAYTSYEDLVKQSTDKETTQDLNDMELLELSAGLSEYQLGLLLDFKITGVKIENIQTSPQYEWLKNNAHLYGFIIRDTIHGSEFKPNALRFVGVEVATQLYTQGITLEDYGG